MPTQSKWKHIGFEILARRSSVEECFGFKKKCGGMLNITVIDIVIDRSESAALAISKVQNIMRYPFTQHSI